MSEPGGSKENGRAEKVNRETGTNEDGKRWKEKGE